MFVKSGKMGGGFIPVFVISGKMGVYPCVWQIWKNWGLFPCLLNLEKWRFFPVFVKSGKIGVHPCVCQILKNGGGFIPMFVKSGTRTLLSKSDPVYNLITCFSIIFLLRSCFQKQYHPLTSSAINFLFKSSVNFSPFTYPNNTKYYKPSLCVTFPIILSSLLFS